VTPAPERQDPQLGADFEEAAQTWQEAYQQTVPAEPLRRNRSGIDIKPLYSPLDWDASTSADDLGFPGQFPYTRGIHASMHRGRPWTPRMVVGLGTPEDYNARMRELYEVGLTGLFVSPCNSHLRGYDADEVERALLGTCGTLICTSDDMARCVEGLKIESESVSLGDTAPYTLSAMFLVVAERRGIPIQKLAGTTNQSDYLSHYAALQMFFRLQLPGQRRILLDHIDWMNQHVPRWNPLSVVAQHMEEAGATPAQAVGFTLSSAIQYADDLIDRGRDPDQFLPRFSFFMSCSMSFFEEVAKFRAARRVWARVVKEKFGATNPRASQLRFHAQTSGADLTRQQPLNNIARVTVQAMAGIFGGLQSLHTDSFDEALSTPTPSTARIAVATQNILRYEAHLDDVVDPLAGSFYVERLTDQMEDEIVHWMEEIDQRGGMYEAVRTGYVQGVIGTSAMDHQLRIERGDQIIVGVNDGSSEPNDGMPAPDISRPDPASIDKYLEQLSAFRSGRDHRAVQRSLDELAAAFDTPDANTYGKVVDAIRAGATHGEVCARVRDVVGFGHPYVSV
jgi:methylmalonyl-CoA mutase N-terminal domain/subunit